MKAIDSIKKPAVFYSLVLLLLVSCCTDSAHTGTTPQARPRNIILFIGDGMGAEHVKAGGLFAHGSGGTLSFESFPHKGHVTTSSAMGGVTDSAAAATALATGRKVFNGVISLALPGDGTSPQTVLEYFKARGKATGLVTTTFISHATPAAFGAHEISRDNYARIVGDYVSGSRPNVLFGGAAHITERMASAAGYTVIDNRTTMQALNTDTVTMVSGQFGNRNLPYEHDGLGLLPHLSEMTETALDILDNDPDGFFLMVEGGRIDHASHNNDIDKAVREVVEFANAVQVAVDWSATHPNTMILVTADHETGGLSVLASNGIGNAPSVQWSTNGHTGTKVPIYGWRVDAGLIPPEMDNTDIYHLLWN